MTLIGISGRLETGKDTVALYLEKKYDYRIVSTGRRIREEFMKCRPDSSDPEIVREAWEDVQLRPALLWAKPTEAGVRQALQWFGQSKLKGDKHYWNRKIKSEIQRDSHTRVVWSDMRMPDEFDLVKKLHGVTWRMIRNGVKPTEPWRKHITETALDGAPFDNYIANNGRIEELYKLIDVLVDGFYL